MLRSAFESLFSINPLPGGRGGILVSSHFANLPRTLGAGAALAQELERGSYPSERQNPGYDEGRRAAVPLGSSGTRAAAALGVPPCGECVVPPRREGGFF